MQIAVVNIKIVVVVLQKTKNKYMFETAIPLLGRYLEDSLSYYIHTFTSTSVAALFTISRTWKQPRHSSTDEQIIKICDIYV